MTPEGQQSLVVHLFIHLLGMKPQKPWIPLTFSQRLWTTAWGLVSQPTDGMKTTSTSSETGGTTRVVGMYTGRLDAAAAEAKDLIVFQLWNSLLKVFFQKICLQWFFYIKNISMGLHKERKRHIQYPNMYKLVCELQLAKSLCTKDDFPRSVSPKQSCQIWAFAVESSPTGEMWHVK